MVRYALVILLVCACTKGQGQEVVVPMPVVPVEPVVPGDGDGDGVKDDQDACPDDPGLAPDGCRPVDSDGDGIIDLDDRCPADAETRNLYDDEDGCPDELPAPLNPFRGGFTGIFFESGRVTLTAKSNAALDRAVVLLREHPEISLEISGHTDGREKDPTKLGLRRAQAVHDYLVAQGVDASRMALRGAGAEEPIDENKAPKGRAKNRRVEFRVRVE